MMPRAISLKRFELPAHIKKDERRFTLSEAVEQLYEQGYRLTRELERNHIPPWLGEGPTSYVAVLKTACGATQEKVMPWPPQNEIRVAMHQRISALASEPDWKSAQVSATIRSFTCDGSPSRVGTRIEILYRERL